ncbi:MAG: dipeptidase [candidate division WOR-3 bacterium]|nr:MAG: dipeptidase [candidate division WOR-3 bacterium]
MSPPRPVTSCPGSGPHGRSAVIDLHTDALYEHVRGRRDITLWSDKGHLDLPRMREGGVDAEVFAVWTNPKLFGPGQRLRFVLKAIREFKAICRREPAALCLALAPTDISAAKAYGRIAGILGVEGGHALEGDVGNLTRLYRRGIRLVTLTWNNSNELGRSCTARDGRHRGLTRLGRKAIRRMNRLGIIVDLSHTSERTFADALEASAAPVICSHSACRALRRFPRNLTDRQLRDLGQQGGMVGIVFLPYFVHRDHLRVTLDHVVDHIEHAASVAGIESVGIGSDFDGFSDRPPVGLEDVTRIPALAARLRERGFSQPEVDRVMGGNFLRVWAGIAACGRAQPTD